MVDSVPEHLEINLPEGVYRDIDDVFQAWSLLETALTIWLLNLMDVEDDVGRIVVDRLDAKTKLMRIKDIYSHFGNDGNVKSVKNISGKIEKWAELRNILAHKPRQGIDPETNHMYFWTGKYIRKTRDEMEMVVVNVADLKHCAKFAGRTAQQILAQFPSKTEEPA